MNKFYLPQYKTVGEVQVISQYSINGKNFSVFFITVSDDIKFTHDENEKGALEVLSFEQVKSRLAELDQEYNTLKLAFNLFEDARIEKNIKENFTSNTNFKPEAAAKNESKKSKECILITSQGYICDIDNPEGILVCGNPEEAYHFENENAAFQFAIQNLKDFKILEVDAKSFSDKEPRPQRVGCKDCFSSDVPTELLEALVPLFLNGKVKDATNIHGNFKGFKIVSPEELTEILGGVEITR